MDQERRKARQSFESHQDQVIYYTYLWLREDGTPYYVGKGHGKRAFSGKRANGAKSPAPDRILIQEFPSEQDAFTAEKFLIAYYGRKDLSEGCLINLTDGGDGTSGHKLTEDQRERLRQSHRGLTPSKETRKNMSESQKLVQSKRSKKWCRNIAKAKMGENNPMFGKFPEKTRQALLSANTGRKISPENLRKMMEARGLKGWKRAGE